MKKSIEVKRIKEGETHTRNQISGILLFILYYCIAVISVNVCYIKYHNNKLY